MPEITFQPSGKTVSVESGIDLKKVVQLAGFHLPVPCGGKGLCGKCAVKIIDGAPIAASPHNDFFSVEKLEEGWRLGCRTVVDGDMIVEVKSFARDRMQVLSSEFLKRPIQADGLIKKIAVQLEKPSLEDQRSDLERLLDFLPEGTTIGENPDVVARLSGTLRKNEFKCDVILYGNEIIDITAPGQSTTKVLAVDIGTTTMAGALFDLKTGEQLAYAGRANGQAVHGDDVISRLEYARQNPENITELQNLVVGTLNELIEDVCKKAKCRPEEIYLISAAGNTSMHHLLLGIDPSAIAESPFIPVVSDSMTVKAKFLGMKASPNARLFTLPNLSGYVGGDIIAGILASGMTKNDDTTLLVDIGTNGEIVLHDAGSTYACSTAAGPAFEGARIKHGMSAVPGAVNSVTVDENDLEITTIEDAPVAGICGTGLVDLIAVLVKLGIIDETGRLLDADELSETIPEAVRRRLNEVGFIISENNKELIFLTQRDIREFQLAKGAVAAGIQVLLETVGKTPADIDTVIIAGAFGNFLRPESIIGVGLLSEGITEDKIKSAGNTSLAGATMCVLSQARREATSSIRKNTLHIELSGKPEFQLAFACAMEFPG